MRHRFYLRKSTLGLVVFLLIFPLDSIFYFLGDFTGFDVPVGILGIVLAGLCIPCFSKDLGLPLIGFFTYALLVLFLIIVTVASSNSSWLDLYFWLRAVALFVSGYLVYKFFVEFNVKKYLPLFYFIFLVLLFISIAFEIPDETNYLRVSGGALLLSLFILAIEDSRFRVLIFIPLVFLMLYKFESRFSIISFFFAVLCYVFVISGRFTRLSLLIFIPLSMMVGYQIGNYYFQELDSIHAVRLLRLIYETENDTSLNARSELSSEALNIFTENPLLGEFKYYRSGGSGGGYAHNFLSYWAEFGLIGIFFTLFAFFAFIFSFLKSLCLLKLKRPGPRAAFLCSVVFVLGFLFAKSYVWSYTYWFIGFSLGFISNSNLSGYRKYEYNLPPSPSLK